MYFPELTNIELEANLRYCEIYCNIEEHNMLRSEAESRESAPIIYSPTALYYPPYGDERGVPTYL